LAIALDTSVNGGLHTGTSLTYSHTCTGSNLILFVGIFGDIDNDYVTGVTYNGVSMTAVDKSQIPGDRWVYLYYLIAPATGANNVVVSASNSIAIDAQSASYTGAAQSSQPDNSTVSSDGSDTLTGATVTLTSSANNCWTFMVLKTEGSAPTAGAGTTRRQTGNNMSIFDSNGAITPAGSTSLVAAWGEDDTYAAVMASFSPVGGAATVNSGFFEIMQ